MGTSRETGGTRAAGGGRTVSRTEFERATGVNPNRSSRAVANLNAGGRRAEEERRRIRRNRNR